MVLEYLSPDDMVAAKTAFIFLREIRLKGRLNKYFPLIFKILWNKTLQDIAVQARREADAATEEEVMQELAVTREVDAYLARIGIISPEVRIKEKQTKDLTLARALRRGAIYKRLLEKILVPLCHAARQVCRAWKQVVDDFAISESGKYLDVFQNKFDTSNRRSELHSRFVEHFATTHEGVEHANPFIGSSVSVSLGDYHVQDNMLGLQQLLQSYGHYLKYLTVNLYRMQTCFPLYSLVSCTPNVEELKLVYASAEALELVQFPKIPKLKTLSLLGFPPGAISPLLLANDHISTLRIRSFRSGLEFLGNMPLSELRTLELIWCTEVDLKSFRTIPGGVKWPISKLYITFSSHPVTSVYDVCLLIQQWAGTLKELELNTREIQSSSLVGYAAQVLPFLILPKLERFTLFLSCYTGLDFLLPTSGSLEHLQIFFDPDVNCATELEGMWQTALENERIVKFLRYSRDPTESTNIRELFPRLRYVSIWNKGFIRVMRLRNGSPTTHC